MYGSVSHQPIRSTLIALIKGYVSNNPSVCIWLRIELCRANVRNIEFFVSVFKVYFGCSCVNSTRHHTNESRECASSRVESMYFAVHMSSMCVCVFACICARARVFVCLAKCVVHHRNRKRNNTRVNRCRVLAHLYIIYCHTVDSKCSYFAASQSVWVNWLFCLLSLHHCSRCCCCVFLCFFILSKLYVQDNGCIFMFPPHKNKPFR